VIDRILKNKVTAAQFEANNGGSEYCEYITNELKAKGYRLNIRAVPAPTNKKKEQRIFDKAPEIREMYFLDVEHRNKEYTKFMQNVFSFTVTGKNKNDDAADSLAMAIDVLNKSSYKPAVFKRPF
jgi:predicted phage terminase large subunit-like protein